MPGVQKRNTIQRKLVLEAVLNMKNHPTAEDVYQEISKTHKSISRGTVYRNLNMLVEDGQISKVSLYDGADRFDYQLDKHNHVKCTVCNKLFDTPTSTEDALDELIELNKKIAQSFNFNITGYEIIFSGICPSCKSKMDNN